MKKRIVMLMAAALLAGTLSGCGEETAKLSEMKTEKYVTLGEYKGIEVAAAEPEVTEDYLNSYIDYMLNMNTVVNELKNRAVADGDTVNIDYAGKDNGVAFEGGTASDQELIIGSGSFIEGFEEGLVGVMPGEMVELNVTFPDPYTRNPDLSGKPVVFTVTVNYIVERVVPELTDEIVPTLNPECTTVEEYKEAAYEQLYNSAVQDYETQIETQLLEKVSANCEFKKEPPEEMVNNYVDRIKQNYTSMAQGYGMQLSDFLSNYYGMTEDAFIEEIKPNAVETAKQSIMLQAISNKEGLSLTEADIQEAMQSEADSYGYETLDEFKELIDEENYKDYAMVNEVLNFLKENAVISNDVDGTELTTEETGQTEE